MLESILKRHAPKPRPPSTAKAMQPSATQMLQWPSTAMQPSATQMLQWPSTAMQSSATQMLQLPSTAKDITAMRQSAKKVMGLATTDEATKQRVLELQNAAIACDQLANQVAAAEAAVMQSVDRMKYASMAGTDPTVYQHQVQQKQEELVAKIGDAKEAASTVQAAGAALDTVAPANPAALSYIARLKNGAANILSKHGKTLATAAVVTAGAVMAYKNRENIGDYLQTAKATYWDAGVGQQAKQALRPGVAPAALPTAPTGFYANLKQRSLDAVGNARTRATQYLNPTDAGTYNAHPGIDPGTYFQEDKGWLARARQAYADTNETVGNARTRATQYLNPTDAGTYNAHPGIDPGTYFQEDNGWLTKARQIFAAGAATRKNRNPGLAYTQKKTGGARRRR